MENKPAALKTLRILYVALLTGMIMFAGISFFISTISEPPIADKEMYRIFLIVSLCISSVCLTVSANLFKKDISSIKQMSGLAGKFEKYRAAAIRNYAFTEAPALFAVIGFFLTHMLQLLVVAVALILIFLSLYPSSGKIAAQIDEPVVDIENL